MRRRHNARRDYARRQRAVKALKKTVWAMVVQAERLLDRAVSKDREFAERHETTFGAMTRKAAGYVADARRLLAYARNNA